MTTLVYEVNGITYNTYKEAVNADKDHECSLKPEYIEHNHDEIELATAYSKKLEEH